MWISSLMSGISECGIDLGENELLHRIWDRERYHSHFVIMGHRQWWHTNLNEYTVLWWT